MKITKETYEAFMLDLLEGTISKEDEMALMLFLEEHPELKEDLEGMEMYSLTDDWVVFDDKESLKKTVDYDRFSDLTIEEIEGEISQQNKKELDSMIELQPALKKDYDLFQKTVLPREEIIYPFKQELKKEAKVVSIKRSWIAYATAIAASVTLILAINTGEKPGSVYESSSSFATVQNDESTDELGSLLEENLNVINQQEEKLLAEAQVENVQYQTPRVNTADGDTSEYLYEPIELIATFNAKALLTNKKEALADRVDEELPEFRDMTLIDRAVAIYADTKKEYIPENYKDMSRLEQIEYATNKIGQVTNMDISMNAEEGEGWSFQAGKFSISR